MVIELSTAFAMRCPSCGRLEVNQINVFQLSGGTSYDLYCECGSLKGTVTRKGLDYIKIDYYCIICDHDHSIIVQKNRFWSKNQLSSLHCLDTNLNLGYYGSYHLIRKEIDRQQEELDSMANELGFDEFADPELMLDVLDYLHDIAASGNLYCECANHDINIELFSDRVELTCRKCQATLTIPASSRDDISRLKNLNEIVLTSSMENSREPKGPWINI